MLIGLSIIGINVGRRLMDYAQEIRFSKKGEQLAPVRPWQHAITAISSALWLVIPLVFWIWAALWFVFVGDYADIVLPALGFILLITVSFGLHYWLDGWQRKLALVVLIIVVILGQLRFNATRPPGSMFESNGSFPFFISLLPVLLGVLGAQRVRSTLPRRQYALMAWKIGGLLWFAAAIGWLVKFLGYYNYQNSYAFDLGSLLETPLRVFSALSDLYYDVIPREIAEVDNLANMNDWENVLAFLGGVAAVLGMWVFIRRRRLLTQHISIQLSLQQKRYLLAFVLISPAVALRSFTSFYPFIQSVILSLQKFNPAFPPSRYIDFRNFEKLSTDLVVRESLEFTLVFVFVSTFFQMALGLAIAHLLNANFSLRGLARTISLIPWAIPMVVAAIGFKWMFDDQFGLIPDVMRRLFGYEGKWLIDPGNAQIAVIFVNIWKSTPFCALLLLAGLQGVSPDLYEAAKVDGANWLDSLRFITLPMLMPIIVTVTMFMLVWQLAVFDLPFAMTGGAPGFSTTVIAQKIYLEINSLNYSFASAVSIVLVFVVTVIGAVGLYTLRRVEVSA
jgi:multiple sugar transport system permease protein